jgi:hypothetical protein
MKHNAYNINVVLTHTFFLFLVSRAVLLLIGVVSRQLLEPLCGDNYVWVYSEHIWLDIWGVWDTGWYLNIAENWYPALNGSTDRIWDHPLRGNYGFFPLYPLLIRLVGTVFGENYVAGILISNGALLFTSYYLFKLARLDYGPEAGLRSIRYLFLFPSAFLLSGVLSESLFLALLVATFYYARTQKWFAVCILGFLLALARPVGVFMVLPLTYEYLKSRNFTIKPDILYLFSIPLGLMAFAFYNHLLTGDWLTFVHIKSRIWNTHLANPLLIVFQSFRNAGVAGLINPVFAVIELAVLCVIWRTQRFSYFLTGVLLFSVPLASGIGSVPGVLRFAVIIFPFYILCAQFSENRRLDRLLSVALGLTQAIFMVIWCNGFSVIV